MNGNVRGPAAALGADPLWGRGADEGQLLVGRCREMGRGPQKLKSHAAQVLSADPPPAKQNDFDFTKRQPCA